MTAESTTKNRRVRPWMLVYTISILLLGTLTMVYGHHKDEHHHPFAYSAASALGVILMFAGNFLYSFSYVTPLLRKIWKFAFPLVLFSFVGSAVLSFIEKEEHPVPLAVRIFGWIAMAALFFPSFRANFLLGYGSIDRVRTIDPPETMSDDPLNALLVEIRKLRRSTQAAWSFTILLMIVIVLVTFFQVHYEKKDDSWVTVRRLADAAKYQEALAVAQRLVDKDPDSPQTRILMGTLQLSLGQLHQAEGSFTRAYELLPNEFNANLLNAVRKRIDETEPIPSPTP